MARAAGRDFRVELSIAALTFGVVGPVAYVAQRLFDYARGGEVDPLSILRQTTVAFYWRSATAFWWAGLAAIAAFWIVRRVGARAAEDRAASRLALGGVALAMVSFVLTWLYP